MNLSGSSTALITPFKNAGLDARAFQDLINWQIDQGTNGIVPCGTTGEAPSLSDEEMQRLYILAVEAANGRVPVIAGCGSNNTAHAIHLSQLAQKAGADALLHVAPYYNKPTQEGLYAHFHAIHEATNLPILIYNIPGRSVVNISMETQTRLAQLPRIAGVKDSTGDLTRPIRTRQETPKFIQLSGEDALVLPFLIQGGDGVISVTSNVAPGLCAQMHAAWAEGGLSAAQGINDQLLPLHDALFGETSPGPVKYAAWLMGLCQYEMRLPMVPISKASERAVEDALDRLNLRTPKLKIA